MVKFLCICQYGHSRSVALARVLHALGHGAVAIGWQTNGGAIKPLAEWADHILLMDVANGLAHVPLEQRTKVVPFDVGPDRWSNPYSLELQGILRERVGRFFAFDCTTTTLPPRPQCVEYSWDWHKQGDGEAK